MDKLVISLATRNRPQLLLENLKRDLEQLTNPNTRLIIQADADDYATLGALTDATLDSRVTVNVQKREDTVAAKWNRALKEEADVYLIGMDDEAFIGKGYDQSILDAAATFPDSIGVVYGRMSSASFSSVMAYTNKWCRELGYILPEYFPYWFSDHWVDDLAHYTGRLIATEVDTDRSKSPPTMEMREPGWWATWFDCHYKVRELEAGKLMDAIDDPPWHKTLLYSRFQHVRYRSVWINDNVRAHSKAYEANCRPPDERYMRLKKRAVEDLLTTLKAFPQEEAMRWALTLCPPTQITALPQANHG